MNLNTISNSSALSSNTADNKGLNSLIDGNDQFQQLLQSSEKAHTNHGKTHCSQPQAEENQLTHMIDKSNSLITMNHSANRLLLTNDKQSIKPENDQDNGSDSQLDNPLVALLTADLTANINDQAVDSDTPVLHKITGEQAAVQQELPLLNTKDKPLAKSTDHDSIKTLLTHQDKVNLQQPEAEIRASSLSKNNQNISTNSANLMSQTNQATSSGNEVNVNTPTTNTVFSQLNMSNQPPAQTTMPTVTLPVTVSHPQWQESFSQQIVMFNRQDIQKAEIRLNPEELGSLHIKLEMNDGKMQLHMAAAHSAVKGVIESALPYLRTSLAEQGIELQQANVSDSSMMANSDQQSMFEQNRESKQAQALSSTSESGVVIDAGIDHKATAHTGLSVFA